MGDMKEELSRTRAQIEQMMGMIQELLQAISVQLQFRNVDRLVEYSDQQDA